MGPDIRRSSDRRRWPQLGWGTWLLSVAALALIAVCTFSSWRWINRPFPGFFLWENRFVPALGDTDWSGYRADVPFPAQVVAVDGQPVESAAEVYQYAAQRPLGTMVTYTFDVIGQGQAVRDVPTMRLSPAEYLWTLGNFLAVGSLLTLLGLVVYALRPDIPAARAMLCGGTVWGLYLVTAADIVGPAWFRRLCLMLQALGPVTLLHLALTFPSERRVLKNRSWLLPAAYGVAVILGITVNAVFDHVPAMLRLNQMHALALAGGGALLIGMLIEGFLRPPTVAARQRIKVAALGAVLAFVLPVAGMALFALSGVSFPLNFLALPLSLFPLAIGWAILKNDLFEVDAIIRRTVAWAVLSVLLAAVYLGGLALLDLIASPRRGRIGQLLFLLIIVAVFPRLRDRVQHAVDFLFARDRYDYRRTVSAASQALATLLDVDAIVDRILLTITGAMHVGFSSVWLRDGGGYRLHAVAGTPRAGTVDVAVGSALTELLEAHPRQIVSDDASPSVVDELHHYGGTLVVPMSFENRLSGFLVLGEKESGASYSGEDLGLLQTLADQGAVAVQNARSYAALVCANDELRAAQSRLLEAERLAAIGELSAAVAHGIRNPLAGIKAAAQLAQMDLEDDHPMQESIRDILAEAGKLEARIKTLLDFARPFEPQPAPTVLRPLIDSAIASLQSQLSEHAIEVSIQVDPPALEAHLDAAQIEEVLLALISNAIEAMTQGGRITITAHPDQGGQAARLEISDTGPGIPAEQLSRVFGLFFTTKSSGTGFGLAVAKKVVERHGGTITVDNRPGEGACFTIVLPLRAPLSRGEGTRRPSDSPT